MFPVIAENLNGRERPPRLQNAIPCHCSKHARESLKTPQNVQKCSKNALPFGNAKRMPLENAQRMPPLWECKKNALGECSRNASPMGMQKKCPWVMLKECSPKTLLRRNNNKCSKNAPSKPCSRGTILFCVHFAFFLHSMQNECKMNAK